MKLLICGMGSIGYRHFDVLRSLGEDEVWAFRSGKGTLKKDSEPKRIFHDLDEALDQGPDGALVTSITSLHVPLALAIARRGIPLFIEKPLSHNFDGVDELSSICRTSAIPVLIGTNLMHHPAVIKIKELLNDGAVGKVVSARAHFGTYMPAWHPWEDYRRSYAGRAELGGGVVLTSIHEISYITDFFGEVEEVRAMEIGRGELGISAEEGVEVLFRHKNGIVSNVHLNFYQRPNRRYCEIIGTGGTLYWDFWEPEIKVATADSMRSLTLDASAMELLEQSYIAQMRHFKDVIVEKADPLVGLDKGIEDLKLATEILKQIGRRN
jgi:predicted dehydrogenase